MDRLFSVFPSGRPGVGLLCLRFGLLFSSIAGNAPPIVIRVMLALAGALAIVGFLTPLAAITVAVVTVGTAGWSCFTGSPLLFGTLQVHGLVAVVATAVALIGPGAYSVDARLFGWRELRMPDDGLD